MSLPSVTHLARVNWFKPVYRPKPKDVQRLHGIAGEGAVGCCVYSDAITLSPRNGEASTRQKSACVLREAVLPRHRRGPELATLVKNKDVVNQARISLSLSRSLC